MIDASILIGVERGHLDITHRIKGREQEEFFISVITVSELLHGVWRAKDTKIKTRRSAFVEAILERFPIFPIDLVTARTHAQLWADLEERGVPIGPHDTWISAVCIAHGYTLVTLNTEEFKRVPGLVVEKW